MILIVLVLISLNTREASGFIRPGKQCAEERKLFERECERWCDNQKPVCRHKCKSHSAEGSWKKSTKMCTCYCR